MDLVDLATAPSGRGQASAPSKTNSSITTVVLIRVNVSQLESLTRNSIWLRCQPRQPSHEEESKGDEQPSEGGFDYRFEILGEAPRAIDPTERPFDGPTLWNHDEAFDFLICSFDDGDRDAARLESGALRLEAGVATAGEADFDPRALAMHVVQQRR